MATNTAMPHLLLLLLIALHTSVTSAVNDSSAQQYILYMSNDTSTSLQVVNFHLDAVFDCSRPQKGLWGHLPPLSTRTEVRRLIRTILEKMPWEPVGVWYQECPSTGYCYVDYGGDNALLVPSYSPYRNAFHSTHTVCYKGVGLSRDHFRATTAAGTLFLTDAVHLLDRNYNEAKELCSVYGNSVSLPPYLEHVDQYLKDFQQIISNIYTSLSVQNQSVPVNVWLKDCVSPGVCYRFRNQTLNRTTPAGIRDRTVTVCFNDTDECSSPLTNNCNRTATVCVNTLASYRCDCNVAGGYVKVNGHEGCLPAQACATSTYGCHCQCQNGGQCPNGTEYCNCPAGFTGQYCEKSHIRFSDWSNQTQRFATEKEKAFSVAHAYLSNSGFPGCFEMDCPFMNDNNVKYAQWPAVISVGNYRRSLNIIYQHVAPNSPTCRLFSSKCQNNPPKLSCNYTPTGQNIRCTCPDGRTGAFCEKIDICKQQNPCQHGGTCIMQNGGDNHKCFCPLGYDGQHCQNAYGNTECVVRSTDGRTSARIFWFRPRDSASNILVTRSFAQSIDICSRHGADILHFIPDSCRFRLPYGGVYANRDLNTQVMATQYPVICQTPIQVCPAFGTLQVPKGHNFNTSVTYAEARRLCHQTPHFQVPWAFHTSQECMQRLLVRMQTLLGLNAVPKVWWVQDALRQDKRKVVCYVAQSNERLPGAIQTCKGYGTLQTASNFDFRRQVSFVKAQQVCQAAGGQQVPWGVPGAAQCMTLLQKKMQQFLGLSALPHVWWSEDATRGGLRHVVCWIPQSNEGYTASWPNLPLISNFSLMANSPTPST